MFSGREKRFLLPAETNAGELQPGRIAPFTGVVFGSFPGRAGVPAPQPPPPPGLVPEPPGQVAETGTLRENAGGERCSGGCPPSTAPQGGVPAPRAPSGTHVTHLYPLPPLGPCASLGKMQHRVSSKMLLYVPPQHLPQERTLGGRFWGVPPTKTPHPSVLPVPPFSAKAPFHVEKCKNNSGLSLVPRCCFSFSCGTISTRIHPPQ